MREYSLQFLKGFQRGLRPDQRGPRNLQTLTQLEGMKPTGQGLALLPNITRSVTRTDSLFPQLLRGKKHTFQLGSTSIAYVDEASWDTTPQAVQSALSPNDVLALTANGQWHLVDAFDTWMLFNGSNIVWRANDRAMSGDAQPVFGLASEQIKTGCYHKGRAYFGGLSNEFFSSAWQEFIQGLVGTIGFDTSFNLDENYVYWTQVGGGDMLWPLFVELAISGMVGLAGYSLDQPALIDAIKRNSFGWAPLPTQGTVLALHPLGQHCLAYCTNGVFALTPVSDPAPTNAINRVSHIGCVDRSAVGVCDEQHVFVDRSGYLWRITPDLKTERLDYNEYITELDPTEISINYDHLEKDFYISDSERCFVLTPYGLCESNQLVTSLLRTSLGLEGAGGEISSNFELTTDVLDFGNRGIKQITNLHVASNSLNSPRVSVWYRYDTQAEYTQSEWKPCSPEGLVFPRVSGVDFKVTIQGTCAGGARLDYLNISYQQSDNRAIRGIYQTQGE